MVRIRPPPAASLVRTDRCLRIAGEYGRGGGGLRYHKSASDMLTFDKWGRTAMPQSAHSFIDRQGQLHGNTSALLDESV